MCRTAMLSTQRRVVDIAPQRSNERADVARWDKQTRHAVLDRIGTADDVGRDNPDADATAASTGHTTNSTSPATTTSNALDAISDVVALVGRPAGISLTAHRPDHPASGRGAPPHRSAACRGDTTDGRAGSARDAEAVRVGETGVMSGILARGGRDRLADMSEEKRQRVVGVPVDGTASPAASALSPRSTGQPPVAVEHLAGRLAIGPAHKGQLRRSASRLNMRPWRSRPPAGPTALSRRAAVSSVGSVMSGRARSSAASVWSSHRYRWSNWWSSSTASRSAAGTVMPSSRSDSMPRPIASTKRFRRVRLRTCWCDAAPNCPGTLLRPADRGYSASWPARSSGRPRPADEVGAGAIDRHWGRAGAAVGGQHPPVSQRQTRAQYTLAYAP